MTGGLLRTLVRLAGEMSAALATPEPVSGSSPYQPGLITTPEQGFGPPEGTTLSPFDAPETAVLRGPMDTVNCGEYAFSLHNVQLIVSMLGTGGGVGGEYDVSRLPVRTWTGLTGRGGTPLPVLVFRDHGALSLQVGHVGRTRGPDARPTR